MICKELPQPDRTFGGKKCTKGLESCQKPGPKHLLSSEASLAQGIALCYNLLVPHLKLSPRVAKTSHDFDALLGPAPLQKCVGDFYRVYFVWRILPGIFLEDFSGHFFSPQKREEKKFGD